MMGSEDVALSLSIARPNEWGSDSRTPETSGTVQCRSSLYPSQHLAGVLLAFPSGLAPAHPTETRRSHVLSRLSARAAQPSDGDKAARPGGPPRSRCAAPPIGGKGPCSPDWWEERQRQSLTHTHTQAASKWEGGSPRAWVRASQS